MNRPLRVVAFTLMLGCLWIASLVAGCVSDPPSVVTSDGAAGTANGESCGGSTECASGHCVDGVCCDNACDSTCESCKLAGSVGQCTAIPDGEDPDEECVTPPLPEAPLPDGGDEPMDAGDAGDAEDADAEAPPPSDAGPTFEAPDGSVTVSNMVCAPKCNGKRACAFPGKEKTCGGTFCGNATTQGRAACNGQGYCDVVEEACGDYACPEGSEGCKTSCLGPNDCATTHFCDGRVCQPKLANGALAASGAQCQSGFVAGGVCCNDACDYAGASCTQAGFTGTCRCGACTSGPTAGSCKLWFKDRDGDGFGDETGTVLNGGAKPGCLDSAPAPDGDGRPFVDNNGDCYDRFPGDDLKAADVRPNQTGWFTTGYGPGNSSFDYNCDKSQTKEHPEFASNATCRLCSGPYFSCSTNTSCGTSRSKTGLGCYGFVGGGIGFTSESNMTPRQIVPIRLCTTNTTPGFRGSVDCGNSGILYNCGNCVSGGNAPAPTSLGFTPQRCR